MPTSQISVSSRRRSRCSLSSSGRPCSYSARVRATSKRIRSRSACVGLQRLDVGLGDAEEVQVLGGDVDAIAGGVAGDVLPEVRELQRRRHLVGVAHQLGIAVAEQRQQQAPDGLGRARRVAAQRRESSRSASRPGPCGTRSACPRAAGSARSRFSIVSASATNTGWSASPWQQRRERLLPAVQRLDAAPLVLGLVGEVVGAARERVQRDQVRAHLGRHEARRDRVALGVGARELLAVGVGALDGPRAGRRIQPADRRLDRRPTASGRPSPPSAPRASPRPRRRIWRIMSGSLPPLPPLRRGRGGSSTATGCDLRCSAMWPRWIPSVASARSAARFDARPALPMIIASVFASVTPSSCCARRAPACACSVPPTVPTAIGISSWPTQLAVVLGAPDGERAVAPVGGGERVRARLDAAPVVAGRDHHRVDAVHDPLVVGGGAVGIVLGEARRRDDAVAHGGAVERLGRERARRARARCTRTRRRSHRLVRMRRPGPPARPARRRARPAPRRRCSPCWRPSRRGSRRGRARSRAREACAPPARARRRRARRRRGRVACASASSSALAASRRALAASGSSTPTSSICAVITGSSASATKPPPSRTMRAAFDAAAITDGSSTAIGTR